MSMLAMVALGFGEIAGAIIQGRIVDKLGTKKTCLLNAAYILVATMLCLNMLYIDKFTFFSYIVTFMWGF
jgi:predicted MFS family arabinose efflux permease